MKHHYRIRIRYNNGFNPVTVPLIACESIAEAQDVLERQVDKMQKAPEKYSGIKSMTVYAGRKRIALRTFVEGVVQ